MVLSEKILQLRKANNLSQEQLASELGISRQSVSKWETGDSTPDVDKIWKLAEVFNVTTDYLLRPDAVNELEVKTTQLEIQQQSTLNRQRRVECRQFAIISSLIGLMVFLAVYFIGHFYFEIWNLSVILSEFLLIAAVTIAMIYRHCIKHRPDTKKGE